MNLQEINRFQKIAGLNEQDNSQLWSRADKDALEAMMQKYSDYLNSPETKSDFSEYANLLKNHTKMVDQVLFDIKKGWM